MQPIRRFILLFLLFASMKDAIHAELMRPSLTAGPVLSWGYTDIYEYVYDFYSNLTPEWQKLSELDWDVHNSLSAGGIVQFSSNYVNFNCKYQQLFYCAPGFMEDYDWIGNPEHLTNYSVHENDVLNYKNFLIEAGVPFIKKKVRTSFTVGFQYLYTSMDGYNGWKTYEEDDWEKISFSDYLKDYHLYVIDLNGRVISYEQGLQLFWTGISCEVQTSSKMKVTASAAFTPFLKNSCLDKHWFNNNTNVLDNNGKTILIPTFYYDTPDYGIGVKVNTSVSFDLFKRSQFVLYAGFLALPEAIGNTTCYNPVNEESSSTNSLGGTGYVGWDVSLSYRIRIF